MHFLSAVLKQRPTHIILSSYSATCFQPSKRALSALKALGVSVVCLWWDTCHQSAANNILKLDASVSKHVILDNPNSYFIRSSYSHITAPIINLFYPYSYPETSPTTGSRDIPVIFLGSTTSYRSVRNKYLDYLCSVDSPVYTRSSFQGVINQSDYEGLLERSVIGINFSMSTNSPQFKARFLEYIKHGCLVLEEKSSQVPYPFIDGEHYISFSSPEELQSLISYYVTKPDQAALIAHNALIAARQYLSGHEFWKQALE